MYLHTLLSTVPPDERAEFVRSIELRSFRRNEVVMRVDDTDDSFYCVADGLLRVIVSGGSSGEDVTTDFIKRDEFFLASAFDETRQRMSATLVAALPSAVQIVPWRAFQNLCSRHPDVLLALFKMVLKRTVVLRKQLRRVSSSASPSLISRALHDLTQLAPSGTSGYDKRITQSVIASYTGLSREQVNKTMRDFESRGLLKKDGQGVQVPPDFAASDYQGLIANEPPAAAPADEFTDVDPTFFSDLLDELEQPGRPPAAKD